MEVLTSKLSVKTFVVEQLDKKYKDLLRYTGRDAYEK